MALHRGVFEADDRGMRYLAAHVRLYGTMISLILAVVIITMAALGAGSGALNLGWMCAFVFQLCRLAQLEGWIDTIHDGHLTFKITSTTEK